ncbi:MAG: LPP20 family lipoprotein [Treponema sp.]|nr:LPP20 family lipoprotein [Treponema sp.]
MKNTAFFKIVFLCFSIVLFASCASTSGLDSPAWFPDHRTAFPDSEYIAQRGRADTEETARTEAVAQIARYFKTSVNANLKTSIQSVTSGETMSETTSVVNDVDVMSQVELFAVEYTDPYYFKKEKKWYCVAYIEREKAWQQYKPTVENAKSEFYAMRRNSEGESDPFSKAVAYGKAWQSGKKFLEKLEYARILNPQKEGAYADDRRAVSEVPSLISAEQERCTVYLAVNGDPISIYPSLDLKIIGKGGRTVYSQEVKIAQKTIAYSLENAQKKAFPILAEEADKAVSAGLSKKFGY